MMLTALTYNKQLAQIDPSAAHFGGIGSFSTFFHSSSTCSCTDDYFLTVIHSDTSIFDYPGTL
eukprot:530100-Pleurochrysis_carterae.AAC.1